MGFAYLDPRLVAAAPADRGRRHLIGAIVRAVDPRSLAVDDPVIAGCLGVELSQLSGVIANHARSGQPARGLIRSIAVRADLLASEAHRVLPEDAWLGEVRKALHGVVHAEAAPDLGGLRDGLRAAVRAQFAAGWDGPARTAAECARLEFIAAQVGGQLVAVGRDPQDLVADVSAALRRTTEAGAVFDALWPEAREFHVACVVEGANVLAGIESLHPGATCVRVGPAAAMPYATAGTQPAGWGPATAALRRFAAGARQGRPACLVLLRVEALDRGTAGVRGRRTVTEILDQYLAGDRLGDLRLGPRTLTAAVGDRRTTRSDTVGSSTHTAYPLVRQWPAGLRPAMRMAHLARTTETPLTRAALTWVGLEAAGFGPRSAPDLAASLSLQLLRQAIVAAYLHYDRTLRVARPGTVPVLPRPDGRHLPDLDGWLALLRPPRTDEPAAIVAARAAVAELDLGELEVWRLRLRTPNTVARWLVRTAAAVKSTLDSLYALRNIALHDGAFTNPGDVALARAGVLLLDLTLEFLGTWPSTPPAEVVAELAGRQAALVTLLKSTHDPYAFAVGRLTSP
ncbi:hypothetical protein [Hamadaea tsunoensis]|uniref:hypothetical protein n=1 Tax=Hamadaea tsunoensis TaxID=53368 RepID=UPI0003F95C6C|nr:hypothetical protein [Hamadaea tsunoensis]